MAIGGGDSTSRIGCGPKLSFGFCFGECTVLGIPRLSRVGLALSVCLGFGSTVVSSVSAQYRGAEPPPEAVQIGFELSM